MNPYASLAKSAVEAFIKDKRVVSPLRSLPKEFLNKKAGIFVTLEKQGQLRGCIGTYLPTKENIAKEIISNAIAAATQDYRFGPIQEEELVELFYTVYLLNQPELVKNIKELNPKKYGIIIKTITPPLKSGLLLPDLDGIDTPEEQISITCQKGEINPEAEKSKSGNLQQKNINKVIKKEQKNRGLASFLNTKNYGKFLQILQ